MNPWFLIVAYSIIYFYCLLSSEDPFCAPVIYGYFIFFYTISYPIYHWLTLGFEVHSYVNLNTILISGMLFYCGVLISHLGYKLNDNYIILKESGSRYYIIRLYLVLFSVPFFSSIYSALTSNVQFKYELDTVGIANILSYFFILFSFIYVFYAKKRFILLSVLFLSLFMIYYLTTGERDMFVRLFLMFLITYYFRNYVGRKVVILVLLIGFLAIPLSQSMKGLLSYGAHIINNDSFVTSLFSGEFMSQGRNFNYMLVYHDRMMYYYDNMLINDLLRFFKISSFSSSSLFGEYIVGRSGGAGIGFTFLGQIYYSLGFFGLFIMGLSIGFILRLLRIAAPKSPVYIYVYITFLFGVSYSLRADFANLLANTIKIGLAPVLILFLSERAINRFR
ncbi:oligosaccharide repeat unit polymerase [Vibrio kanaloae]|uniref:O-antigen polymerase n=1 Tax=Vibrio kanaloae TaxID=170673 RepID=UPI0035A5FA11